MFERFTTAARAVVTGAVEEAQTMGSGHVGSEHLLLAILRGEEKGLGQVSLAGAGVTYSSARAALERVGESSLDADALRSPHIGDGHLLLGLLRGEAGRGARLLHDLGVDPGALRTRLTSALRQSA